MLQRRLSYLLGLALCAGCSRLPAQQGQPCRVTISATVPTRAGLLPGLFLDDERNLQFYIFDMSGELVTRRGADPGNALSCSIQLPPDKYIWRVSAGDSPVGCATVEEYEAHMPSFGSNDYSEGFPMSAGGILMAGSGHNRVDAVLGRNYSRIVIRSLSVADGNLPLLSMRSLRLDRIFLMGVPDRVHMDGRSADGEPGCRLLNCWNGSATDFCGGSMERCTVAAYLGGMSMFGTSFLLLGTTLYCLPCTSAGIVVECSGMDMLGRHRTMFWTFRMPFQAGCSYECDIRLTGEGGASPAEGGGCRGTIGIEVTPWVESGGAGYCSGRSITTPLYLAGELRHPGDCADVDFLHIYGDTAVHPQDSSVVRSIGAGKHWKLFAVGAGHTSVYIDDGLNLRELQFDIQ